MISHSHPGGGLGPSFDRQVYGKKGLHGDLNAAAAKREVPFTREVYDVTSATRYIYNHTTLGQVRSGGLNYNDKFKR